LEIGEPEPDGEHLFTRAAFKQALPEVSKLRLEHTLYAEHPTLRALIEQLHGGKTAQTLQSLSIVWRIGSLDKATEAANQLVDIGFFERRGNQYWIPFLYRDALDLIQGAET
jgi:hypothetical protein